MKKTMLIFSVSLLIVFLSLCMYVQYADVIDSVEFIVKADTDVSQNIRLFEKNDKHYVFLPSYTDLDSLSIDYRKGCSLYLNGNYIDSTSSFSDINTDKDYLFEIKNFFGITVCKTQLVFMKSANIPSLEITMVDGTIDEINEDKEVSKSGFMTLINSDKSVDYRGNFYAIHGRGNSSWVQKKKPYTLEFSDKVNLISLGEYNKYVLVANAMDESNLRNKIVYDAARELGMLNSVNAEFVDLYINHDYVGLYLLVNHISVLDENDIDSDILNNTQKLNQYPLSTYEKFEESFNGRFKKAYKIPNNPDTFTGTYLLELELKNRVNSVDSLFTTNSGQDISVKVPKYASVEQLNYISDYINNMEEALGTEAVLDYLDAESWSNVYLLQEVFANVSKTSFFFQKFPDDVSAKLISGPLWDFDLTMGTNYDAENASPYQLHCNWGWFEKFNSNDTCMDIIKNKYVKTVRPIVQNIVDYKIDEYQNMICKSYLMNEKRWEGIQYKWWVNHYDSQEEHGLYLKDFLSERLKYLDYIWLGCEKPEIEIVATEQDSSVNDNNSGGIVQESLIGKLVSFINNENTYIKYGIFVLGFAIVIFVYIDVRRNIQKRRMRNERKR